MALAERAELVARLSLKDDFSGRLGAATSKLKGMEGSLGRIAGHANRGLKNAATNLAKIGVIGAGFVGLQVRSGIQSLAELEDATVSVDGAIKQMGLTGRLTSQQVAGWANEIERDVQAAFDDKAITQAATTLLRFGQVAPKNLRPAMVVMTDLAAKTGDVDSAASLMAKALAAPEKAAGKLARVGIILTAEQQKQITAMVKAGDAAGAQAVLLGALEKATKGAAAAAKGPYNDAMNILKDVTEDAQRALGEAFLPLLGRVADKLSKFVGDKANMDRIRNFGKGLADGFEKVLEVGSRIPWGLIGDSLQTAGKGAKIVFDALTGLPPWIQTAVLTGWGLNKLTGGALGSIIGEGIKVTFGQFAARGATPANPLFVSQVGGIGGTGGGVVPGGKGGGALKILGGLTIVGTAAMIAEEFGDEIAGLGTDLGKEIPFMLAERMAIGDALQNLQWPFGPKGAPDWASMDGSAPALANVGGNRGQVQRGAQPFDGKVGRTLRVYGQVEDKKGAIKWDKIAENTRKTTAKTADVTTSVEGMRGALAGRLQAAAQKQAAATERSRNAITARLRETKAAQLNAANRITAATRNGDSRIVTAIRNNRPQISVRVTSNTIRVTTSGATVSRNINPNYMRAGTG